VYRKVHHCLTANGLFLFSVEHPIFTALPAQDWYDGPNQERLHWPVDNYQEEGRRHTQWLTDNVIKYHRTIATYINSLIDSGFRITNLVEPKPSSENMRPDWQDEYRRPLFLLIKSVKSHPSRVERRETLG
jgi:hypothetical protein